MFALCKFKCANHKLPIVTGRYEGLPVDERICTLCDIPDVGDEFHYLFKCNYFNDLRTRCLNTQYYIHPNMEKTKQLFNVSNKTELLNLAKFIYQIVYKFKNN